MANTATLETLAALRAVGKTAEEAEAALAADPRFALIVQKEPFRALFATGNIKLKLRLVRDNPAYPMELRSGCERILSIAAAEDGFADLTNLQFAAEFRGGVLAMTTLPEPEGLTAAEAEQVLALGGGYLVERLSAAEVTEQWAWMDAVEAAEAAETQVRETSEAAIATQQNRAAQAAVLLGEVRAGNLAALETLQALAGE